MQWRSDAFVDFSRDSFSLRRPHIWVTVVDDGVFIFVFLEIDVEAKGLVDVKWRRLGELWKLLGRVRVVGSSVHDQILG